MTQTTDVDRIEQATATAYSWDRYSRAGWRAAIRGLLKRYTPEAVIEIMRSKIPRWAADSYDAPYGRVPGKAILQSPWLDAWDERGRHGESV